MLYIALQTQIQFISSKPSHHTSSYSASTCNAKILVSETLCQRLLHLRGTSICPAQLNSLSTAALLGKGEYCTSEILQPGVES